MGGCNEVEIVSVQSIGVKIALEGAAEYERDLKTATRETKALKSELELASRIKNPFERASSMKGVLTTEIGAQQEKIRLLTEAYQTAEQSTGKFSEQTLKARDALDKAQIALDSMQTQLKNLPNGLEMAGDQIVKYGEGVSNFGRNFTSAGKTLLPITGAVAGAFAKGTKDLIDYESAYNGVMKTIDASEKEYAELSNWIKQYSREVGVSKEEIAGVMQIVGQLGVRGVSNIIEFTKASIEMGEATDWTSSEAADNMARFMNIFETAPGKVRDLGNVLVALGNNMATTEPEIGEMATRLASAGRMAGLTEEQVLALAASMTAVGINAEAGGSSMSKVLSTLSKTVELAGTSSDAAGDYAEKLDILANMTSMSAEEFKKAWSEDTIGTLLLFIENLNNLDVNGKSAIAMLDDLGFKEIRVSNALRSLTLTTEEVYRAQEIANREISNGSALSDEASVRWGELSHRVEAAKQALENVGMSIAERLLPYLEKGIDFVQRMVDKWDSLSPAMQDTIVKTAAISALIGPLLIGFGSIFTGLGSIISAGGHLIKGIGTITHTASNLLGFLTGAGGMASGLSTVTAGMSTATGAAGALAGGSGLGSIIAAAGPYAAALGLVVTAGVLVVRNWDDIKEAAKVLKERTLEHLSNFGKAATELWNSFNQKTDEIWVNIMSTVGNGMVSIGRSALETFGFIKDTAGNAFTAIKNFAADGWNTVIQLSSEGLEMFKNLGAGIASNIANGIMSAFQLIQNAVNAIKNLLGGAVKTAASWGADVVKNMSTGITNKASTLKTAASSAAKAIKERLGFSEPEKGPLSDFHTYMPDMMNLMAKGIKDNIPTLREAVNKAAYAMLPPSQYVDLPDGGNSYQTNMGGVQIVINQQPGQDAHELAEVLEEKLVALEERRMYAYGMA